MSILILKFWYVACAIFCLYNLKEVAKERYQFKILAGDQNPDSMNFLICQKLTNFQLNRTKIRLEELRDEMIDYFNRSKYPPVLGKDFTPNKNSVLNHLGTGQYLISNGLLCIILKNQVEGLFMNPILSSPVYFFVFENSTLDFAPMASSSTSYDQVIVQKRGPPYSNCSESNGRVLCLNECFKKKFRLSRYLYEGNETGIIHLSSSTNRTIEESEMSCFEKCWRENCKIVQLIPFTEDRDSRITWLKAHPKLSGFDFWVQFIGLVCSFANISLNQLTSLVVQYAISKVKRRRVRIGLFCLKWAILFLSLACCGYFYTTMFLEYKASERTPPRKEITRNHIKQKTVRLAFCVDIKSYLIHGYLKVEEDGDNFDINHLKKTMLEIEKVTIGSLDDYLKGIYLNYQGRLFRVNYTPEPKVLFKKFVHFFGNNEFISRCFILPIHPGYQLMPSSPKLTIKLGVPIFYPLKLYVLAENENLNEGTFEFPSEKAFKKRVVRRLEGRGCIKSREQYKHCTSRRHCVEICINRGALDEFKKIPIEGVVVDKDQFSLKEWSKTYPIEISDKSPYVHRSIHKNISEECEKKFEDEHPCNEVKFKETVQILLTDYYTMEIDLFLDVELSIEELTWFKLFLDILNIQSIFFGMTALKMLRMLYRFFKPTLRIRNDKIAHFLIYLLCSIGFTYHTFRILDLTINQALTYSPDYEIAKQVPMPVLVFCFPIDQMLIDKNHQLTGNYLEQLTSDMIAESVFESILYLDESNGWTPFNLSLVERFLFLHFKCFNISIDLDYDRRQFYFSENRQLATVLKVNFTNKFWNEVRNKIFFMTKTNETTIFSNVANLVYDLNDLRIKYSAEQSELTINYEDRFSFIKRLLSTPYDDDFNDLDGQLPELKSDKFNFKTLKVPVEKKDFVFELQDDLFEQLFIRINQTEMTSGWLDSLDYQQTSVFNRLKEADKDDTDLILSLALVKKTLSAKNEENLAKLVLNLLNVLFLWFDLGILDLHPIFVLAHDYLLVYLYLHWPLYLLTKITQFLFFISKWLKKFEKPLYIRLNARKLRVPRTHRV